MSSNSYSYESGSNAIISTLDGYVGTYVTDSENEVVPFDPVMTAWAPIGDGVRMTLDILYVRRWYR